MTYFGSSRQARAVEMVPGVFRRTLGTTPSMMLVEITVDGPVPIHQHPHEQIGYVVRGQIEMTVGEQVKVCSPGDMYAIPGNTPHGARPVGGPCVVVDIFSPHREEYR